METVDCVILPVWINRLCFHMQRKATSFYL